MLNTPSKFNNFGTNIWHVMCYKKEFTKEASFSQNHPTTLRRFISSLQDKRVVNDKRQKSCVDKKFKAKY